MVNIAPLTIECLAMTLSSRYHSRYHDGLVMRLGQGWEANNAEAIAAWLQSSVQTESRSPVDLEQVQAHMAAFLRNQSEQLWESVSCCFPEPQPYLPQIGLSLPQCRTMAHALIEMLATWQPIEAVEAHCAQSLSGKGSGVQKLAQWLHEQQACFSHHPSELTDPFGHELIRVLYPAFRAEH